MSSGRNDSITGRGDPVDTQQLPFALPDGTVELIPAIDARWTVSREWGRYQPLLGVDHILVQSWHQSSATLLDGVKFALRLPFNVFWSTALHDGDFGDMVDSFLRGCPRMVDGESMQWAFFSVKDGTNGIMLDLYKHMLLLIIRLACRTENDATFMSTEYYASIVCSWRVFPLPRIMDICALYVPSNGKLIRKMVRNLCKVQPAFEKQFDLLPELLCQSLERATRDAAATLLLEQTSVQTAAADKDSSRELCHYAADFLYTLEQLLVVYPALYRLLFEAQFCDKLATFVSGVCAPAARRLSHVKHVLGGFHTDKPPLRGRLDFFTAGAVSLFHRLVQFNCLYPILTEDQRRDLLRIDLDHSGAEEYGRVPAGLSKVQCGESFFSAVHKVLEHKEFIWQYNETYPIVDQLRSLQQAGCSVEEDQIGFMAASMDSISVDLATQALNALKKSGLLKELWAASSTGEVRSKVQFICDMLPHLAPAFVQLCLMHFHMDSERTLDALLGLHHGGEQTDMDKIGAVVIDHLPLPRDLRLLRAAPQAAFEGHQVGSTGLGDAGFADAVKPVTDGFKDLLNLKPSVSAPKQEKPSSSVDINQEENNADLINLVDDLQLADGEPKLMKISAGKKHNAQWNPESELNDLKQSAAHIFSQFQNETPFTDMDLENDVENNERLLYDDEYDDTYDGQICVDDAGAIEERLRALRSGNMNRNFDTREDTSSPEIDTENPPQQTQPSRNEPHKGSRDKRPGHGPPANQQSSTSTTNSEYTGGRQRQLRDRHRAQAVKHDRKWRSAKKMQQGMG